jgi:Domain of unknown function (DUF4157)
MRRSVRVPPDRSRPLPPSTVVRSGGRPLPAEQARTAALQGHDLSAVRIHDDAEAAQSARALGARAYTVGRHLVFGAGEFAPKHPDGAALLAHELTHAAQQGFGEPSSAMSVSSPADATEREAAEGAAAVRAGRAHRPSLRAPVHIARQVAEPAEQTPETAAELEAERARLEVERSEFEADRADRARARVAGASRAVAESLAAARSAERAEQPAMIAATNVLVRELAAVLSDSIEILGRHAGELERRLAGGEPVAPQLAGVQGEIADNRHDLDVMRGLFAPSTLTAFAGTYKTQLDGAKCMVRAYEGLGTLFGKAEADAVQRNVAQKAKRAKSKGRGNIDQIITVMETARRRGLAGPRMTARWSQKRRTWTPTLTELLQSRVSRMVPGVYFFGFAPAQGYHSVIIAVNTWRDPPALWWGDQFGVRMLTMSLDEVTRAFLEKEAAEGRLTKYKDWRSDLWQLLPPADTAVVEAGE